MPKPRVLIIDDEPGVCYSFQRVVTKQRFESATASTIAEGVALFESFRPHAVVLDLNLPDGSGLDAFRQIRRIDPHCPVVFITAHGSTEAALEAMTEGAFDYLVKPVDSLRLGLLLERAVASFEGPRPVGAQDDFDQPADPADFTADRLIGRSPVMQEMCKLLGLLAPQEVNVLILGESGVGKELVARALYRHSRRADRPFVALNCAALPEHLLESELFGHEKGAFTSADRQRIGKFEQCQNGTLFLDEIGDMSLSVQSKMLRVLQDQRFERLGGSQTVQTRVRLLAATNQDLERRVADGRFRADLYYRLKVATVLVPPLRHRLTDVDELVRHFVGLTNAKLNVHKRGFAPEALDLMRRYEWPGNVRELQSVVKEAMVRARGPVVLPEYLPPELRGVPASVDLANVDAPSLDATADDLPEEDEALDLARLFADLRRRGEPDVYAKIMTEVDRFVLAEAMRATRGNQVRASELLGIDRKTLRQRLRGLGLVTHKVVVDGSSPAPLARVRE